MAKKYNNKSAFLKDWTTPKLKQELKSLTELIYKVECFGTRDVHNSIGIEMELIDRGVTISRDVSFN